MNALPFIEPSLTMDQILPDGTFFAPRSSMEMVQRVFEGEFRLDTVTGNMITIMGNMPLICSENVASPQILDFFRRSGLKTPTNLYTYEDQARSVEMARGLIQKGLKLACIYPPPLDLQAGKNLLVPLGLYNWLNDKSNLGQLVDSRFLSSSKMLQPGSCKIPRNLFPGKGLFVKACFPGASGGGKDVLYCPDAASRDDLEEWISTRREGITGIRVEEEQDIATSWCVNLAIGQNKTSCLGSAIQLFREPSKQTGSRIDPDNVPPASLVDLAISISEQARNMGYRGIAGFDIGVTSKGQQVVFDLNFRIVASTMMVLLHNSAVGRVNARISESWSRFVRGPIEPALERLSSFADNGSFVPTRLYQGTSLSGGLSLISGMLVAGSLPGMEDAMKDIDASIEDIIVSA